MLLDSNIFIYAIQPQYRQLRIWCLKQSIAASDITRLEVLGYSQITDKEKRNFSVLFDMAVIYPISSMIIEQSILLR